jgi:hypothetical protein
MEGMAIAYVVLIGVVVCFAIGSFLALPLIWLHVGHISRKLDKIIKLLELK